MKVLRSTEWEPSFWVPNFPGMGPAYLFRHREFNDILALKVAKYVDVEANDTYVYNAETRTVTLRFNMTEFSESSLPVKQFA